MTTRSIARKNAPIARRLRELMLYVAGAYHQRSSFDAPALATALYLCDFAAYDRLGRSITGSSYVKGPHGPAPVRFTEVFGALVEAGRVAVEIGPDGVCVVPAASAGSDSLFTASEIALVDEVVGQLADDAGSEWSYGAGWKAVAYGEEIPYYFAGVSDDDLSDADLERVREIAAQVVSSA